MQLTFCPRYARLQVGKDDPQPCFPLCFYCRSVAEAELVWQLQPTALAVENRGREVVAAAFLTNVVACSLFEEDETAEFFAVYFTFSHQPTVFFSW